MNCGLLNTSGQLQEFKSYRSLLSKGSDVEVEIPEADEKQEDCWTCMKSNEKKTEISGVARFYKNGASHIIV